MSNNTTVQSKETNTTTKSSDTTAKSGNKFVNAVKSAVPANKREAALSGVSFTIGSLATLGVRALIDCFINKKNTEENKK